MKTLLWSGLFLVSFMGGHFVANQWLSPVGYILLFIKLYVTCLLGFVVFTWAIPYFLQLDSGREESLRQTSGLDINNGAGGMRLSCAVENIEMSPEKPIKPADEDDKDLIRLYYRSQTASPAVSVTTATLPGCARPEAKIEVLNNTEFMSSIGGLTLRPSDQGESLDDLYLWSRRARLTRRTLTE